MTYAEALTLPDCPECCCPTEHRVEAALLSCRSSQCSWLATVDEPLRQSLTAPLISPRDARDLQAFIRRHQRKPP